MNEKSTDADTIRELFCDISNKNRREEMNEKRIGADRIRVEIKSRDILSILSIIYDRHNAISRDLDREVPEEFQLSCSSLQVLSEEFDKLGYLRKILSEALHAPPKS